MTKRLIRVAYVIELAHFAELDQVARRLKACEAHAPEFIDAPKKRGPGRQRKSHSRAPKVTEETFNLIHAKGIRAGSKLGYSKSTIYRVLAMDSFAAYVKDKAERAAQRRD